MRRLVEMMKFKNNKGVTLLVLTITIIVLLIVTSMILYNSKNQLAIKNVNNLYSDIEAISTKVSDYYLKNNSLPIFEENTYIANSTQLGLLFKANGGTGNEINPNDSGPYYVINLSKLDNLTLNYGRDYKNWSEDTSFQAHQDIYIINGVTHQIYYPQGITLSTTIYFTKDVGAEPVEKIESSTISDEGFQLASIQANKNTIDGETKIMIDANITLTISSDFQKDTLKYGWKAANDTNEITFTQFALDESNSAKLTSKLLNDNTSYYLYIKVLDINGEEHTIEKNVTID